MSRRNLKVAGRNQNKDVRTYLLIGIAVLVMGAVTYWMYADSEKASRLAQEKKAKSESAKPAVLKEDGLASQGVGKVTGSFKSILDNPLQSRTPPPPQGQTPVPPQATPLTHVQSPAGESYYKDAR